MAFIDYIGHLIPQSPNKGIPTSTMVINSLIPKSFVFNFGVTGKDIFRSAFPMGISKVEGAIGDESSIYLSNGDGRSQLFRFSLKCNHIYFKHGLNKSKVDKVIKKQYSRFGFKLIGKGVESNMMTFTINEYRGVNIDS